MKKSRRNSSIIFLAAIAVPIVTRAGESKNSSGDPTDQGTSTPAITISYSGQTALRTFTNSQGISTLQPGGSITLNYAAYGGGTVTYYASNDPGGYVQLARIDFTQTDTGLGATSNATADAVQYHSAIRTEWHEQGSVQGQVDLINDQIGYVTTDGGVTGFLSILNSRGPSTANPTWVNSSSFTTGASLAVGHSLSAGSFANTYDSNVYDLATGRNKSSGSFGGVNGQDRIQFAIGEYKTETLAKAGTGTYSALPGAAGFGKGNSVLSAAANTTGIGIAGGRQQFFDESIANQSTDKVDPQSTTSQHYATGPWNTAGANNIDNKQIAVTAVTYSANPGTGLRRINKGDAQWLLTTGRLQNGADFNVVNRANDAGQRTVPAVNVGVDPSWSVGENDDGNTNVTANANIQKTLGAGIRFSGKTSGTAAQNAIQQSRLGFGPLSLAENRSSAQNVPVRALAVDFEHQIDSGNVNDFKLPTFDNIVGYQDFGSGSIHIYHPVYRAVLVSHYNTIKAPRPDLLSAYQASNPGATSQQIQNWWNGLSSAQTGIKGDPNGNVAAYIGNIANSIGGAGAGLTPASANNPADALFGSGFMIPGLLNYSREYDGQAVTTLTLSAGQQTVQNNVKANYGNNFTTDSAGVFGTSTQTVGSNAYYGVLNVATVILNGSSLSVSSAINGGTTSVLITAKNNAGVAQANGVIAPAGNYLFGNFNQDGRRDYASVKESVNAALSLHNIDGAANSIYTAAGGVSNATIIPSLTGSPAWTSTAKTKGDLVILGDYNSDGAFDGKDVYLLARGASLSDNGGTDHLGTGTTDFADKVRDPNAKLNKNAALNYINSTLNTPSNADQLFLRQTARAVLSGLSVPAGATSLSINADGSINYTFDPNGVNAFNKFDVNRDGRISRQDAAIVDALAGKDYRNLNDQLAAVVRTDKNSAGTAFVNSDGKALDASSPSNASIPRKSISLVDVELNDSGTIDVTDFNLIRANLGSGLTNGDANFDGVVNVVDLFALAQHWNTSGDKWSTGDFTGDGLTNLADLQVIAQNWNQTTVGGLPAPALGPILSTLGLPNSVPEPASVGLIVLGSGLVVRRRRRN